MGLCLLWQPAILLYIIVMYYVVLVWRNKFYSSSSVKLSNRWERNYVLFCFSAQRSGLRPKRRNRRFPFYSSQSSSFASLRSSCLLEFFTTWRASASPGRRGFRKVFASARTTCGLATTSADLHQSQFSAVHSRFNSLLTRPPGTVAPGGFMFYC